MSPDLMLHAALQVTGEGKDIGVCLLSASEAEEQRGDVEVEFLWCFNDRYGGCECGSAGVDVRWSIVCSCKRELDNGGP